MAKKCYVRCMRMCMYIMYIDIGIEWIYNVLQFAAEKSVPHIKLAVAVAQRQEKKNLIITVSKAIYSSKCHSFLLLYASNTNCCHMIANTCAADCCRYYFIIIVVVIVCPPVSISTDWEI